MVDQREDRRLPHSVGRDDAPRCEFCDAGCVVAQLSENRQSVGASAAWGGSGARHLAPPPQRRLIGPGPGLYTDVFATDVYIKAFIDGRLGYSSAVGVLMAAIMVALGLVYLRVIVQREFGEAQ